MNFAWMLLARADFGDISNHVRGKGLSADQVIVGILILGSIAVSLWLIGMYYNWVVKNGTQSPAGLFRELCHSHQLDFRSTRLLNQLASWHKLAQPARIFLEPQRFDANDLGPQLTQHQAELRKIRDRIFASPAE